MSFVETKPCHSAADVWERARRVQALRKQGLKPRAVAVAPSPSLPPPRVTQAKESPPLLVKAGEMPSLDVRPDICRIPIVAVVRAACDYFDAVETAIFSLQRVASAVFQRHICIYAALQMTHLSTAEIARRLMRGDHSTVIHARDKIEALLKAGDEKSIAAVEGIIGRLRAAFPNAQDPPERLRFGPSRHPGQPSIGRKYSVEEKAEIIRLWTQEGASPEVIAQQLGRTAVAIERQAQHLGLDKSSKPPVTATCCNPECGKEYRRLGPMHQYCSKRCQEANRRRRGRRP